MLAFFRESVVNPFPIQEVIPILEFTLESEKVSC